MDFEDIIKEDPLLCFFVKILDAARPALYGDVMPCAGKLMYINMMTNNESLSSYNLIRYWISVTEGNKFEYAYYSSFLESILLHDDLMAGDLRLWGDSILRQVANADPNHQHYAYHVENVPKTIDRAVLDVTERNKENKARYGDSARKCNIVNNGRSQGDTSFAETIRIFSNQDLLFSNALELVNKYVNACINSEWDRKGVDLIKCILEAIFNNPFKTQLVSFHGRSDCSTY